MMEKVDVLIKDYLRGRQTPVAGAGRSPVWPDARALYAYLSDELKGDELQRFLDLLRGDAELQTLVLRARELAEAGEGWKEESVPAEFVARAQGLMGAVKPAGACPHCGKPITPFKKPLGRQRWLNALWLAVAVGAFALSFKFPYHFMQCLLVSLLAGIKAVVDWRSTKTQILIYKALSDSEKHDLQNHPSRL